jgi:vacuolar protein sorting-associated protein 13A/C
MGKVYVPIMRNDTDVELIRVHVTMEVATVFIVLNKEEGRWPYRIDNKSSRDISFTQYVSARYSCLFSRCIAISRGLALTKTYLPAHH